MNLPDWSFCTWAAPEDLRAIARMRIDCGLHIAGGRVDVSIEVELQRDARRS